MAAAPTRAAFMILWNQGTHGIERTMQTKADANHRSPSDDGLHGIDANMVSMDSMATLLELMLTMATRNMVPDAVWERQGQLLERGVKGFSEIAKELGVSPQTVSREMKRRGYRKNALLHVSVAEIERRHAKKARHREIMDLPSAHRRQQIAQANMQAAAVVMKALVQAEKDGDITKANAVIEPLAAAVGIKLPGKRRRA